jgi:hypothetical protein
MKFIECSTGNIKVLINPARIRYVRGSVINFDGGATLVVTEEFNEIKGKIEEAIK